MATLLILIAPCVALTAPLLSPAINIFAVLVLTVLLGILMTTLLIQTWILGDLDENESVIEDAAKFVRAAFVSRARGPGASFASFRVESGMLVHRHFTAPNCEYGFANGTGFEEEARGSLGNVSVWTDEEGSEVLRALGKRALSLNFRKGLAAFRLLGGFGFAVRRLEGSERVFHMV